MALQKNIINTCHVGVARNKGLLTFRTSHECTCSRFSIIIGDTREDKNIHGVSLQFDKLPNDTDSVVALGLSDRSSETNDNKILAMFTFKHLPIYGWFASATILNASMQCLYEALIPDLDSVMGDGLSTYVELSFETDTAVVTVKVNDQHVWSEILDPYIRTYEAYDKLTYISCHSTLTNLIEPRKCLVNIL